MNRARFGLVSGGTLAVCTCYNLRPQHDQSWIHHRVHSPSLRQGAVDLRLRAEETHNGQAIGLLDWPAGRVLLQWAIDVLPPTACVLEVGAGIGTAAIGLALAGTVQAVVATDYDPVVTRLMRENAAANGVESTSASAGGKGSPSMLVAEW